MAIRAEHERIDQVLDRARNRPQKQTDKFPDASFQSPSIRSPYLLGREPAER
jgi:hypothetical protein